MKFPLKMWTKSLQEDRRREMAFYNVCPKCGAHLDPNEKCDCENVSEKEKKAREHLLLVEKGTNQLAFRWPSERAGV